MTNPYQYSYPIYIVDPICLREVSEAVKQGDNKGILSCIPDEDRPQDKEGRYQSRLELDNRVRKWDSIRYGRSGILSRGLQWTRYPSQLTATKEISF
ncbi:unnamed protein product [Nezara viridula]|uniref:Uncharacterized protein n=1 Tax=Nezara viridula TaxID=85310 RepID=A0A9P0MV61_NEZVI|nr:unnamed protein product [Nezara viridula]